MKSHWLLGVSGIALLAGGCYFNINIYENDEEDDWDALAIEAPHLSKELKPVEPPTIYTEGRYHFSAQPDVETLRGEIKDRGVTTVVNFRRDVEMESVPFDERLVVEDAGATYVHIPLGGGVGEEPGYDPEDVDRLAEVLKEAKGNVLLHCASGSRARTIWTAYLIKHEGLSEEEATQRAQKAGQEPSSLDRLLGKPSVYTPPAKDE